MIQLCHQYAFRSRLVHTHNMSLQIIIDTPLDTVVSFGPRPVHTCNLSVQIFRASQSQAAFSTCLVRTVRCYILLNIHCVSLNLCAYVYARVHPHACMCVCVCVCVCVCLSVCLCVSVVFIERPGHSCLPGSHQDTGSGW